MCNFSFLINAKAMVELLLTAHHLLRDCNVDFSMNDALALKSHSNGNINSNGNDKEDKVFRSNRRLRVNDRADVNAMGPDGMRALHFAAQLGKYWLILIILFK